MNDQYFMHAIQTFLILLLLACLILPTMFISVETLPVFPLLSVAVHVCTPKSRDLRKFSLIDDEEELEAKQLLHVDDH